jgi:ABC-type branched-subunit amino acid transport system ATPase component
MPAAGVPHLVGVDHARKQYGGLVAVNDVSFEIKAGEILGLIGPNGAGKSTTFDLITGVQPLTGGRVVLAGRCRRTRAAPAMWRGRALRARSSTQRSCRI